MVSEPSGEGSSLPPHPFAIAATAYGHVFSRTKKPDVLHTDQSILVSGESGAGKTETTKFIMQFLSSVGGRPKPADAASAQLSMDKKVMTSNPILESYGNAKTLRNNNSSRSALFSLKR